jgi:hypothetical protein
MEWAPLNDIKITSSPFAQVPIKAAKLQGVLKEKFK